MDLNCLLICLLVDPEYQKEAEQRHRELAAKAGGFNDFATLAVIFEQCKSRYVSWSFILENVTLICSSIAYLLYMALDTKVQWDETGFKVFSTSGGCHVI